MVNILSEGHWTSTCVVTLKKFRNLCNGSNEASAVLSHLSGCGKAHKISINRGELIEVGYLFIFFGLIQLSDGEYVSISGQQGM